MEPPDLDQTVTIGVHQGPCAAVGRHGRLEYAGITVDAAAGLERACRGGQVVVSLAVCRGGAAADLLDGPGIELEEDIVPAGRDLPSRCRATA